MHYFCILLLFVGVWVTKPSKCTWQVFNFTLSWEGIHWNCRTILVYIMLYAVYAESKVTSSLGRNAFLSRFTISQDYFDTLRKTSRRWTGICCRQLCFSHSLGFCEHQNTLVWQRIVLTWNPICNSKMFNLIRIWTSSRYDWRNPRRILFELAAGSRFGQREERDAQLNSWKPLSKFTLERQARCSRFRMGLI